MIRVRKIWNSINLPIWLKLVFVGFVLISVFRHYIANDLPLVSQIDDTYYFPVLYKDLKGIGVNSPYQNYLNARELGGNQWNVLPIIPYHANTIDKQNIHFISPFGNQHILSWRYRHWMGTDQLGRDVLARTIHGSYTALKVSLFSTIIALIIGLFLGLIAGYYQDNGIRVNIWSLLLWVIGLSMTFYISIYNQRYYLLEGQWTVIIGSLLLFVLFLFVLYFIDKRWIGKISNQKYAIPLDLMLMRVIEVYKSIPFLLLIFIILAMIRKPSLTHVIWIIGLTRWTTIARYIRAEVLHIRGQEYIKAAISSGMRDSRVMMFHALPNAISPIIVTVAFSMSSAILLESTLSFLGIGMPTDAISWGAIIQSARQATDAWWVAVFPGMAIFILVFSLNKVAELVNKQ